jgi:hypothetical protein
MLMLFLIKLCFCSGGQLLYNSCYSTSIVKIYFVFGFCRKSFFRLTPGLINTLASGFPSEKPASIAQPHLRSILGNLHVFFPALTGALDPSRPLVRNCLGGSFSHQHLQGKLSNVHLTVALRWSIYLPDISDGA